MNARLSVGINISIFCTLTIFAVLLFLPLRLLLNTSYDASSNYYHEKNTLSNTQESISIDFRRLRVCPKYNGYQFFAKLTFLSNYDRNCSYSTTEVRRKAKERLIENNRENNKNQESSYAFDETGKILTTGSSEEERVDTRGSRRKNISIASHILAVMLVVSVVAALIEVLRIRLSGDKDTSTNDNASPRRASLADLAQRRLVQRETMRTQRSFEMMGMHRSALRLLGARPPPLVRRSSFPTQRAKATLGAVRDASASRRPSVDSDDEVAALHHRSRLIRRH